MQVINLTNLQDKLFTAVKARLEAHTWYAGIYVGCIPSDDEISADFEAAVEKVCRFTEQQDNPEFSIMEAA